MNYLACDQVSAVAQGPDTTCSSTELLNTECVQDIDGKDVDFKKYAGKVLLFVNLASQVSDPPAGALMQRSAVSVVGSGCQRLLCCAVRVYPSVQGAGRAT